MIRLYSLSQFVVSFLPWSLHFVFAPFLTALQKHLYAVPKSADVAHVAADDIFGAPTDAKAVAAMRDVRRALVAQIAAVGAAASPSKRAKRGS